jgi:hypothetical protein
MQEQVVLFAGSLREDTIYDGYMLRREGHTNVCPVHQISFVLEKYIMSTLC